MLLRELFGIDENNGPVVGEGVHPDNIQNIIDNELGIFKQRVSITDVNGVPDTGDIPIEKPTHWLRVKDVICVFVDMAGSTKMSATQHPHGTAQIYRLFTNTAIRMFHNYGAAYIDVKGDGVFALFDRTYKYTALASAVSFKTFVNNDFTPTVERKTGLSIGGHFGIDQRTVLVRKLGLKRMKGRTDRQNEVWAGRTVNMAAKLASKSKNGTLWVSDRYFQKLKDRKATHSCGCPGGFSRHLWQEYDLTYEDLFDFDTAYYLESEWCKTHGKSFCKDLITLDANG